MRTYLTVLMIAVLCLAALIPAAYAQDSTYPYQGQPNFIFDGTVTSVDPDRDRAMVSADSGEHYTLDTYHTDIHLLTTSRLGDTGDLVAGMRVHVSGTKLSSDIIAADQVRVLPYNPPVAPVQHPLKSHAKSAGSDNVPGADDRYDRNIKLRGTVVHVDEAHGQFTVQVNDHVRPVLISSYTDLSDYQNDPSLDRRTERVPVRAGERVSISGLLRSDGTVLANWVRRGVSPSDAAPDYRHAHTLIGRVDDVDDRYSGRKLKIRLGDDDADGRRTSEAPVVEIEVPRQIPIQDNGKSVSMHDFDSNDVLRVDGSWDRDKFKASRITVVDHF